MLVSIILRGKGQNIKWRLLSTLLLCHAFNALTACGASAAPPDFGGGWESSVYSIKARGCKPTRMRSCFLMGRQQSTAASRCTVEANAILSIKLQELGKHCQVSVFILMNAVLKQMAIKQEVCLFVCWVNRLHSSQKALLSPQWNKSTYLGETSAIPHFEFSDQEVPSYNS